MSLLTTLLHILLSLLLDTTSTLEAYLGALNVRFEVFICMMHVTSAVRVSNLNL